MLAALNRRTKSNPRHASRTWDTPRHDRSSLPQLRNYALAGAADRSATYRADPMGRSQLHRTLVRRLQVTNSCIWTQIIIMITEMEVHSIRGSLAPLIRSFEGVPFHDRLARPLLRDRKTRPRRLVACCNARQRIWWPLVRPIAQPLVLSPRCRPGWPRVWPARHRLRVAGRRRRRSG